MKSKTTTGTYIIAEVAQAHDGSLGMLHSYIDALAETGIDAIKFQTHIADAESSTKEQFRKKFSFVDDTRYDYWRRMEFTFGQWQEIQEHCREKNVEFLSSPFSVAAVELLERLDVNAYKIGSGCIDNYLLLDVIKETGKPIMISTGLADLKEVKELLDYLDIPADMISLLHCVTQYPVSPECLNLEMISILKSQFPHMKIGYSDHSGELYPNIAAVALGAELLEFHAVFDKRSFGPDSKASLEIDQIVELTKAVRGLEKGRKLAYDKSTDEIYLRNKSIFGYSLSAKKEIRKGEEITILDLESKKPAGAGISVKNYRDILGKTVLRDIGKNEFINMKDLQL